MVVEVTVYGECSGLCYVLPLCVVCCAGVFVVGVCCCCVRLVLFVRSVATLVPSDLHSLRVRRPSVLCLGRNSMSPFTVLFRRLLRVAIRLLRVSPPLRVDRSGVGATGISTTVNSTWTFATTKHR